MNRTLRAVKALALVVLVASCSSRDACDRLATHFTDGFLQKANPKPDVVTMADVLAERLRPVVAERCRADGWSDTATACQDPACLVQALTDIQRNRFTKAIEEVIHTPPARAR
jgi:hypothetical protein